jgi:hypothetical protein
MQKCSRHAGGGVGGFVGCRANVSRILRPRYRGPSRRNNEI